MSIRDKRENLRGTVLFAIGTHVTFGHVAYYVLLAPAQFLTWSLLVLPHCNTHPVVMSFVFVGSVPSGLMTDTLSMNPYEHLIQVQTFANGFLISVAFSLDFTRRVKAVSSGMIFGTSGEEPLDSPVAGLSARNVCLLACGVNWASWIILTLLNANDAKSSYLPEIFRNHIPMCSTLAVLLAFVSFPVAIMKKATTWSADLALAIFSCTPLCLLLLEYGFLSNILWTPPLYPLAIQHDWDAWFLSKDLCLELLPKTSFEDFFTPKKPKQKKPSAPGHRWENLLIFLFRLA